MSCVSPSPDGKRKQASCQDDVHLNSRVHTCTSFSSRLENRGSVVIWMIFCITEHGNDGLHPPQYNSECKPNNYQVAQNPCAFTWYCPTFGGSSYIVSRATTVGGLQKYSPASQPLRLELVLSIELANHPLLIRSADVVKSTWTTWSGPYEGRRHLFTSYPYTLNLYQPYPCSNALRFPHSQGWNVAY
jgi:hypothetical protein